MYTYLQVTYLAFYFIYLIFLSMEKYKQITFWINLLNIIVFTSSTIRAYIGIQTCKKKILDIAAILFLNEQVCRNIKNLSYNKGMSIRTEALQFNNKKMNYP